MGVLLRSLPPAHPAAQLFPEMEPDEFAALRRSIEEHGQQEPVVLHEGAILDGRHRYRACVELGIEPLTCNWAGSCGSPTAYVIAMNLNRRHLTASQKAAVGAEMLPLFEAEARERQREAGRSSAPGRPAEKLPQIVAEVSPPKPVEREARQQAASAVGVNRQYISDAKAIREKAPDVFESVRAGAVTIPEAKREIERREIEADYALRERAIQADPTTAQAMADARLAHAFSKAKKYITSDLLGLKPAYVALVLSEGDWVDAYRIEREISGWFAALRAARPAGLRVVGGSDA